MYYTLHCNLGFMVNNYQTLRVEPEDKDGYLLPYKQVYLQMLLLYKYNHLYTTCTSI